MDKFTTNGGGPVHAAPTPDNGAHGRAALLLAESLMHGLLAKGVISREDFIDIVEGAAEVEEQLARARAWPPSDSNGLHLFPLAAAFQRELGR